jgi:hypothetical protein
MSNIGNFPTPTRPAHSRAPEALFTQERNLTRPAATFRRLPGDRRLCSAARTAARAWPASPSHHPHLDAVAFLLAVSPPRSHRLHLPSTATRPDLRCPARPPPRPLPCSTPVGPHPICPNAADRRPTRPPTPLARHRRPSLSHPPTPPTPPATARPDSARPRRRRCPGPTPPRCRCLGCPPRCRWPQLPSSLQPSTLVASMSISDNGGCTIEYSAIS